jgi:hypothetical protein
MWWPRAYGSLVRTMWPWHRRDSANFSLPPIINIEEIFWSVTSRSECHHRGMARESNGHQDGPHGLDPVYRRTQADFSALASVTTPATRSSVIWDIERI